MHASIRISIGLLLIALCAACAHRAPTSVDTTWNAAAAMKSLSGGWVVDLRGSPADSPYTQPFVVASVDTDGRTITGKFYGSDITWSRINTAWGKVVVTFITSDGLGEYTHAATLEGDTLVGTSTAKHRNLLVPWTAKRVP
ncbi:MAG: hypothetical protein H7232_13865 [Aeromicrobium sp.]|nr:hypothetical protein [Burkholderiales bacterium]